LWENVVKTDKCIGVSRFLGVRPGCPPVYTYGSVAIIYTRQYIMDL